MDSPLPLRLAIQFRNYWTWGLSFALAGLLLVLYYTPYRGSLEGTAPSHWLVELVAPGISRRWKAGGGLILGLFTYGILESVLHPDDGTWFNWPQVGTLSVGLPSSLASSFQSAWPPTASTVLWSRGPASLIVLLLVANAVVVLIGSNPSTRRDSTASEPISWPTPGAGLIV